MHLARHRGLAAALLTLGVLALGPLWAAAQADPSLAPPSPLGCGSYDELRALLRDRFGERPTSTGVSDEDTILQVFTSDTAGTWTIVQIETTGTACVLATGRSWQQELAAQGEPA